MSLSFNIGMYTYLEKINPEANEHRYCSLRVDPDLFGRWALFRQWSRIDDGGSIKMDSFEYESQALDELSNIVARKVKRGYRPLS